MPDWAWAIIVLTGETVITTIVGLIIKKWWDKKEKDKEELIKLREAQKEIQEEKRCSEMRDAVHAEIIDMKFELKNDIKPLQNDLDLMKKTMQKDTRRSLRQDGKMYCDRGYASPQEKTEFDELYWAYHNLGKNGVVDRLHEEVMSLPDEPKGDK